MSSKKRKGADSGANLALITLQASVRISDLVELKQSCDAALADGGNGGIACDGAAVASVDAAALQFLAALRAACLAHSKRFELRAPSDSLLGAAQLAGFVPALGLDAATA